MIKYPKLEELAGQVHGWKPNVVYVYGGVTGERAGLEGQAVGRLEFLHSPEGASPVGFWVPESLGSWVLSLGLGRARGESSGGRRHTPRACVAACVSQGS